MTPSRHANLPSECLQIGVGAKWPADSQNDEIDAERTSGESDRLNGDEAAAGSCTVLTQGVQLCLVQSLRDVRDQIGRVFDADRQPDRGVENAYFLADVSRNAVMSHECVR